MGQLYVGRSEGVGWHQRGRAYHIPASDSLVSLLHDRERMELQTVGDQQGRRPSFLRCEASVTLRSISCFFVLWIEYAMSRSVVVAVNPHAMHPASFLLTCFVALLTLWLSGWPASLKVSPLTFYSRSLPTFVGSCCRGFPRRKKVTKMWVFCPDSNTKPSVNWGILSPVESPGHRGFLCR